MISTAAKDEFSSRFKETSVRFDEPLAPYLAYRVGGPADVLVFPRDESDLAWIADASRRYRLPVTVVGTGTNLLVTDYGIEGIVVSLLHAFQDIKLQTRNASTVRIRCGAGVEKPALLRWAVERSFGGLEFSAGVPGTLGGGIYMNAGTKYGCYADILKSLTVFDFEKGLSVLSRDQLYFGYREQTAVRNSLVVSMEFELQLGDRDALQREVDRIVAERGAKQPLDFPSCGSTFKNPDHTYEGLSAGRLIEKAGLKGTRIGGAEISHKHANFILNKENARAADILSLIDLVQERVKKKFGVELECEVIILGRTTP